ncbi:MAG: hypothetical protein P8Y00_00055 [Deltaproteobacteria bacterium]
MNEKPNEVRAEYDVDVRLIGSRTVRIRARNMTEAIEMAQRPVKLDNGAILFYEAVSARKVEGD